MFSQDGIQLLTALAHGLLKQVPKALLASLLLFRGGGGAIPCGWRFPLLCRSLAQYRARIRSVFARHFRFRLLLVGAEDSQRHFVALLCLHL